MARKKQEEQEAPGIVVLYTSLMILLLAFFILLNTLGKTEEAKVEAAFQSLMGTFGFQPGGVSPLHGVARKQTTSIAAPISPVDQDYLALRGLLAQEGLTRQVKLLRSGSIRSVEMPAYLLFEPDTFDLSETAKDFLLKVAQIIQKSDYPVSIKGHTDDAPSQAPGETNWSISAKRALAVLEFLVQQGINPKRLAAIGMAGFYPMVPNSDRQHRLLNNRVTLVFDTKDKSYYQLPDQKVGRQLEFKGFVFDLFSVEPEKDKESKE